MPEENEHYLTTGDGKVVDKETGQIVAQRKGHEFRAYLKERGGYKVNPGDMDGQITFVFDGSQFNKVADMVKLCGGSVELTVNVTITE